MMKLHLVLLSLAALLLSACSDPSNQPSGLEVYETYDRPASWPGKPSEVRVKVSTSRQRVYVMEGDKPLLVMPVSVGYPGSPTPKGKFRVSEKNRYKRANSHGYAYSGKNIKKVARSNKPSGWSFKGTPLPYWVEFKPNYGFHTGWIKHTPCTSDGCIRMHQNVAPKFFALVKVGTPISIASSQPEDAKYGSIPLPPDAGPLPDYPSSFYLTQEPFAKHLEPVFE
ncbi:L,D-transpeptidase [Haloferula sp.]|uniref:L,D-transpeptidase n=1 Tax=Haloferula sp. TaxID=2497595 RepID=UPI00329D9848